MKPVLNPADGFVEFIWSTIDPTTKRKLGSPLVFLHLVLTPILVPLVSALTDLGPIVKAVLEDPNEWEGMEIPIVGDVLTIPEVAETYTKVTGQPARAVFVHHIPQEAIPQWIARHKGYKEVGYFPKYVGREHEIPVLARKLFPGIKTFEQWMRDSGLHLKREK